MAEIKAGSSGASGPEQVFGQLDQQTAQQEGRHDTRAIHGDDFRQFLREDDHIPMVIESDPDPGNDPVRCGGSL